MLVFCSVVYSKCCWEGASQIYHFYCVPSLLNPLVLHFLFCWTKDNFLLSPRRSLQYNLPSYWLILLPCQEVNFHLSFVTPGRLLLIPLRSKSYFFLRALKGLQKELCHFCDGKFFPLVPHASCCPLYRHENKGLNHPLIPFPSVLCSFSLAGDLLCLLESLWVLLPALQRCLCAGLAGAGRHGGSCQPCRKKLWSWCWQEAGAAKLRERAQRMPARVKHPVIDFPAELCGECESWPSITANLGIPCDYCECCHAFSGLSGADSWGFCRRIIK